MHVQLCSNSVQLACVEIIINIYMFSFSSQCLHVQLWRQVPQHGADVLR